MTKKDDNKVIEVCPRCGLKVRGTVKSVSYPVARVEFTPDKHRCYPKAAAT